MTCSLWGVRTCGYAETNFFAGIIIICIHVSMYVYLVLVWYIMYTASIYVKIMYSASRVVVVQVLVVRQFQTCT